MICPNCDREAEFTEHEQDQVETHGLDCGPYEHWTQRWITCNLCGAPTDDAELARIHASYPAPDPAAEPFREDLTLERRREREEARWDEQAAG
jgi:hypothetical protein